MKYLLFTFAVIGILPLMVLLIRDRRLIRWAVWGLLLPLVSFNSTSINFFSHEHYRGTSRGMEVSLIYIAALTLLFVMTVIKGRRQLLPEGGSRIYLAYFLFTLPSIINATNMLYSFFEIWKMVMIHLVFLAVYYYLELSDGDIDIILYGVAILVTVNFIIMLFEHFTPIYHPQGIFPHQNSMAMFMTIAGLIYFSRFLNNDDRGRSWIFFAAFLMASFAVVRSYSRGAIFCYPLGTLLTLGCSIRGGITVAKMRKLLLLALLVIIGLIVFTPRIIQRFQTAPEASGQTRRNLAIAALKMVRDRPFIGVGVNNWGETINLPAYSAHRDWDKGQTDEYRDGIVETIYLLVAAECGIPCLIALLCWFGYYWFSSFFLLKKLRMTNYYFFPAGTWGALTAVFMQSTLEWVLKQQINLIWLVMVFAILSFFNKHHEVLKRMQQEGGDDGIVKSDDDDEEEAEEEENDEEAPEEAPRTSRS